MKKNQSMPTLPNTPSNPTSSKTLPTVKVLNTKVPSIQVHMPTVHEKPCLYINRIKMPQTDVGSIFDSNRFVRQKKLRITKQSHMASRV